MHHYWGYGLHIASEIEFPELLPFQFENPDIFITIGKAPENLDGKDVLKRVRVSISPTEYLLTMPSIANYYVCNGEKIIIEPQQNSDEKSIRLFTLSNAFAAVLYQRNLIPLHASGIVYNDGIILFSGQSGAGKSTLLTALQQKGYTVFTDDICVLSINKDSKVQGQASYPIIKLWKDSFQKLSMEAVIEENKLREHLSKYGVPFHDAFITQPLLLKQVYILKEDRLLESITLEKLTGINAHQTLLKTTTYRPLQIHASDNEQLHFRIISKLSQQADIYNIKKPSREINTIQSLVELIEKNLPTGNE